MAGSKKLDNDLSLPLIVAPMFLVSNSDLVFEVCKQGAVGSFPALNERTSAEFEKWLIDMNNKRDQYKKDNPNHILAPYAVNLIVHQTNPRVQKDLALCVKHKVPIIITSLGAVPEVVNKVHGYGGIVLHDVTNVKHAKKAISAGVDGLIAVTAGAGGHAGTMNPSALIGEIRQFYNGTIVLAGGLSSGKDILAAKALGADYAYMGTRFIATQESAADKKYKKMVCDSHASDIVYTAAVSGVPANFLSESLDKAGYDVNKLKDLGAKSGKLKAIKDEAKAWKTIWSAGHGVSNIEDVPKAGVLVKRLRDDYEKASKDLVKSIKSNVQNKKLPDIKP